MENQRALLCIYMTPNMPFLRLSFAHPVFREGQGLEAAQAVAVAGVTAELVLEGQAARVRIAAEVGDGVEAVVGHVHVRAVRGDAQPVQARETADRLNEGRRNRQIAFERRACLVQLGRGSILVVRI